MQFKSRNKKYLNIPRLYSTSHWAMQDRRQTTLLRSCHCAPSFKCTIFINIALVALKFTRACNAASCANQRQYFILVHRNAESLEQWVLTQKNIPHKAKTIVMFAHVQEPNSTQLKKSWFKGLPKTVQTALKAWSNADFAPRLSFCKLRNVFKSVKNNLQTYIKCIMLSLHSHLSLNGNTNC